MVESFFWRLGSWLVLEREERVLEMVFMKADLSDMACDGYVSFINSVGYRQTYNFEAWTPY